MPDKKVRMDNTLNVTWIVLIYIVCGVAWILFSDYWLEFMDVKDLHQTQTYKGIFYVLSTGVLLFIILNRFVKKLLSAQYKAVTSEQRFRDIFQHANDGIALFAIEPAQSIINIGSNDLFQRMTGYTDDELRESEPSHYLHFSDKQDVFYSSEAYGQQILALDIVNKDGEVIAVEVNSMTFPKEGHLEVVSIFRDIRDRKLAEETIHFLANHDYLTNLPNPRVFHSTMNQHIANKEDFLLFIVRVNRFSWSRNTLGRTHSNELIQMISDRLVHTMNNSALITRMNDDSFEIMLPGCTYGDYQCVYGKIKERFLQPFIAGEDEIILEVDIGVSCYPIDGQDAEGIIRCANYTLSIEIDGESDFVIDEIQRNHYRRKLLIEEELPFALQRGQLSILYQPKVDLVTGNTVGVEALLRWNHPDLGAVTPDEFIPIAEEIGTIISIGEWVLLEACQQLMYIQKASGKDISMAVNISTRQFMQRNFVGIVKQAVSTTSIHAEHLILEITESIAMNVESSLPVLQQLKALGVKISMDDFGTGYSSLAYLKHMPLDELKIDRSFIQDLLYEKSDRNLVEIIITLAHSMNFLVVAEGVEDETQLNRLKELRCQMVQGYYYSRPLDIQSLIAHMSKPVS